MICGHARAEKPAERIFLAGRSNRGRTRRYWPDWFQRSESREFVGSSGHLGTQPVEYCKSGFFCARGQIACGAYAGRAALLAGARGDQFTRFLQQQRVRSKEWFGKPDIAGVGVVQVEI